MRLPVNDFQDALRKESIDAWMMYDMRGSNDLAWQMLDVPPEAHCTRRWAVVVPSQGAPVKIVHRMEQAPLSHLEIDTVIYDTRQSWMEAVRNVLAPYKTVAMEYSPMSALPVVSRVDAGIVDILRSMEKEVVSSANMLQTFTAVLNEEQIAGAVLSGGQLKDIVLDAFAFIRDQVKSKGSVSEYAVQQFIMSEFARKNLTTDSAPIVAIGPNAASPHYAPSIMESSDIQMDDVVVIDAWCRHDSPGSVFADITWVGYVGENVPHDVAASFHLICKGRDAALDLVRKRFAAGEKICGFEVDRACRDAIIAGGMGEAFIHRTGHNIGTEVHGPGANMDDFETHDTREILLGTSFSIEPGVYIPETLGLRTEIDVIIDHDGTVLVPTEPIQQSIIPLMSPDWQP